MKDLIAAFEAEMPYRKPPFEKRNWGHPLHSLCSYQGKLKPSIAHWLIKSFVPEGGAVLDPLGGVGTIPLEAAMAGRSVVSNDKSPFPATVGKAKLDPPPLNEALDALNRIAEAVKGLPVSASDQAAASFGLNAKVSDYFHPDTLDEILKMRRYFLERSNLSRGETFVFASLLHILHGNRPYALSRRSHPITPFSPTGPVIYKNVVAGVSDRMVRALRTPLPEAFIPGLGLHGDFRELPQKLERKFDAIITSPPFAGMRFDRPNWLRLWFCGWEEASFHKTSLAFLERQQSKSLDCYQEFFATCQALLSTKGSLILHMGGSERDFLPAELARIGQEYFNLTGTMVENVEDIERHGLSDKGRTTNHHFLFFQST